MKNNPVNIVLVRPEIPQNTGGIGRLCVATGSRLHLVRPFGFSLDDKYLRRAGMDYWRHLDLTLYDDWEEFCAVNPAAELVIFSTGAERSFWDCDYPPGVFLVFGNESSGLPPELYSRYAENMRLIPMPGSFNRSLNLANSAAIALYEVLRRSL